MNKSLLYRIVVTILAGLYGNYHRTIPPLFGPCSSIEQAKRDVVINDPTQPAKERKIAWMQRFKCRGGIYGQ